MGILRPIVQAFVLAVLHARQYLLFSRAIAAQLIGDQHTWDILASLEQFPKELLGSLFVPSALHQDIEHIAMLINCSPEIVQLGVDAEKDLVKVPFVAGLGTTSTQLLGRVLAKFLAPLPDRFIAEDDPTLGHQFFDIAIAEWKTEIEPDRVRDNLRGKAIARVGGRGWCYCHATNDTTRCELPLS
jgi:hypothetical protein